MNYYKGTFKSLRHFNKLSHFHLNCVNLPIPVIQKMWFERMEVKGLPQTYSHIRNHIFYY